MPQNSMFSSHTIITGGNFSQHQHIDNFHVHSTEDSSVEQAVFERLEAATSPGAFHNSGERFDPPRCHPNTRIAVLNRIMDWITSDEVGSETLRAFIMWLYGPAGAGKSAIAQTISELCHESGILLASFFFSRTDPTRSHARALAATIAYQVALNIPQAKAAILATVKHDPLIFTRSLEAQLTSLVFEPLHLALSSSGPGHSSNSVPSYLFIVIDGLDECQDVKVQNNILNLLSAAHRRDRLPPTCRLLITSRPEQEILSTINKQFTDSNLNRLALDNAYRPDDDIRLYLGDKFREVEATHPHRTSIPAGWPTAEHIDQLVRTSSGQFIYASTVMKYISSARHRPSHRLDVVLGLRPVQRDTPFAELDALYRHIFSAVEDIDTVLKVLGLAILGLSEFRLVDTLEEFLDFETGDIPILLGDLGSIISIENGREDQPTTEKGKNNQPSTKTGRSNKPSIRILHASLKDFLFGKRRSDYLYLQPAIRHAEYANISFRILQRAFIDDEYLPPAYYVYESLVHHFQRASPTVELRQAILDFSVEEVYLLFNQYQWYLADKLLGFVSGFMTCLKSLQWEDAGELYSFHQGIFDKYLKKKLGAYYLIPRLTLLVAAIAINMKLEKFEDRRKSFAHFQAFQLLPSDTKIDNEALSLLWVFNPRSNGGEYGQLIYEFLADADRCEAYGMNEERYATAALCCLQSLCASDCVLLPALQEHLQHRSTVVAIQLKFLVNLLESSGKSDTLLEYARERTDFPTRVASEFPEEAKLAWEAVEDYIGRNQNKIGMAKTNGGS